MNLPRLERLIVDIGGSYADIAVDDGTREFIDHQRLVCAPFDGPTALIQRYLKGRSGSIPRVAALAVRGPVVGDWVEMPEPTWRFSIEETRRNLQLDSLVVVNDFTALAMALPMLHRSDVRQVGAGEPQNRKVLGVLGAGTGLGVSGLIPLDDNWVPLSTEGGHTSFSPNTPFEQRVLDEASRRFGHVSFERVLSGAGLGLIHDVWMQTHARPPGKTPEAHTITAQALSGDPAAREVVDCFCEIMGTAAANLALTLGAVGGIYISGAIIRGLGSYFDRSGFRQRFEAHGRFQRYLQAIPTYVITHERATALGISAILEMELRRSGRLQSSEFLDFMRRMRDELSNAERNVADLVLSRPRQVLNMPVKDIAREAKVSEPTVIRLCRTLGCLGLHDFKLRLSAGLASAQTSSVPINKTHPESTGKTVDLGVALIEETASTLLNLRGRLHEETLAALINALQSSRRIVVIGVGHYAFFAQELEMRLVRMGFATSCYVNERLIRSCGESLRAGDVIFIFSGTGRVDALAHLVTQAKALAIPTLAITTAASPLSRTVDHALVAEHEDGLSGSIPTTSRTLHLLLSDIVLSALHDLQQQQGLPQALSRGLTPPVFDVNPQG